MCSWDKWNVARWIQGIIREIFVSRCFLLLVREFMNNYSTNCTNGNGYNRVTL